MIKIYQRNIIYSYLKNIVTVSIVFLSLSFFLNILEEIKFFKNTGASIQYPIFLTFLNLPSIIYELFPFIILISTQLFFLNAFNKSIVVTGLPFSEIERSKLNSFMHLLLPI